MKYYRPVRNVLVATLAANLAVALTKIVVGNATGSTSMTADGFHSLADGASNVVGLIGISLAARPADADHPYGHRKFETLAAAGIAALLFFAAQNVVVEVIDRLKTPVAVEVGWYSFAVMAGTLAVNLLVARYEYRAGKRLGSVFLVADSFHTRSDIYVSLSVVGTLAAVRLGYPLVDLVTSLVIAGLIVHAGYLVLREAASVLCDRAVIEPGAVEETVLSVQGVKACHKVRSRGREDDVSLDLHLEVEQGMTLEEAHALSHRVAARLRERFPELSEVLVHVEPARSGRRAVGPGQET
ncbi:MAG: cation diffusion facilitator family transporter [Moorellales bacterium]